MHLGRSLAGTRSVRAGRNYPGPTIEHENPYSDDLQVSYSDYPRGFTSQGGNYLTPEDYSASWGYDSTPRRERQTNDYSSYTSFGNPSELYPSFGGSLESYAYQWGICLTSSGSYTCGSESYASGNGAYASGSGSYSSNSDISKIQVLTIALPNGPQVQLLVGHMVIWQSGPASRR